MAKILITGASGFLGRNLIEEIRDSFEIIPLVYKGTEKIKTLGSFKQIIECDLTNFEATRKSLNQVDFDILLHLAGFVYPSLDASSGYKSIQNNILATFNILEAIKDRKLSGIIYSSTTAIYGDCETPYIETGRPQPSTIYGLTKLSGEHAVQVQTKRHHQKYLIVRFSNMFGRYQLKEKVIPSFIVKAKRNEPLSVYSSETKRDFLFVKDACRFIIKVLLDQKNINNEIYNCSSGIGIKMADLVDMIIRLTDSRSKIIIREEHARASAGDHIASYQKARDKFAWKPETTFSEGIKAMLDYY